MQSPEPAISAASSSATPSAAAPSAAAPSAATTSATPTISGLEAGFDPNFESVAFHAGSFLVFLGASGVDTAFGCLQLRPASSRLAIKWLFDFLDKRYPGPAFFAASKRQRGKTAALWLTRAGRVYWGIDRRHLQEGDGRAAGEALVWPESRDPLIQGVAELLELLAPHAQAFYKARSLRFEELWSMKALREKVEPDNDTQPSQKRIRLGSPVSLPVRDKTSQ